MNLPNFKDILQKLSVVKNNTPLLISIIIVVVAALLFVPAYLLNNKLKKKIELESINNGLKKVQSLNDQVVSNKLADIQVQQLEAQAKDTNDIINLVRQSTERELLSYDIFPEPDPNGFSQLVFQQFGQQYRKNIEDLISRYNGRDCPTITELQRRLQESMAGMRGGAGMEGGRYPGSSFETPMSSSTGLYGGGREMMMPGRGMPGMGGMDSQMTFGFGEDDIQQTIIDEVCLSRAKNTSIYINPADLSGYDFWANYKYDVVKEDAIQDCWYYQMGYWITEDIFDTIFSMNSTYENVLTAPVKRFMQIGFTITMMNAGSMGGMYGEYGRGAMGQDQGNRPAYVLTARDGLTESCTGRFSNAEDDIDIIHFNITVVVNAKMVLPFIRHLCSAKNHKFTGYPDGNSPPQTFKHNQITVLESTIKSISPNDYMHTFYRYGDDPVVELDLVCEYLLKREGYEVIKPEQVKLTLSGAEQT
jgi:hypothetical protein